MHAHVLYKHLLFLALVLIFASFSIDLRNFSTAHERKVNILEHLLLILDEAVQEYLVVVTEGLRKIVIFPSFGGLFISLRGIGLFLFHWLVLRKSKLVD